MLMNNAEFREQINQLEADRERAIRHVQEMVSEYLKGNESPQLLAVSVEYAQIRRRVFGA
jgi:hypothetical protein